MAKYKIVAQGRPNLAADFTFEMEGLQGVDVQLMEANAVSDEEFLETAKDADALIVRGMPVSEIVISGLEKCKIIALGSVGTDIVDVRAATAKGIPVTNCPDTFIQEVAEHTAVLILAATAGSCSWTKWSVSNAGLKGVQPYTGYPGCTGRPWA